MERPNQRLSLIFRSRFPAAEAASLERALKGLRCFVAPQPQRVGYVSFDVTSQQSPHLLLDWYQDHRVILWILGAAVVGFVIGRYRARRAHGYQNRGEALVSAALRDHCSGLSYHLMNHVTLELDDGTTQIDHVLVSRFGVFVIETKDYRGWIFADAKDKRWTQVLFRYRFSFQNPILQNRLHVQAVQARLNFLPASAIKSVVVFAGGAEFMTPKPPGVFYIPELVDHLREQTVPVMSLNRMQFCVGRLEATRLEISGKTDVEHVENLVRRHGI
jgi:hypothetical protein